MLVVASLLSGCGKEGPPLPPLRLMPAPVGEISAGRAGTQVELRFVLPTTNQNAPGPIDLGRVEIYAATTAPGVPPPAHQDLLAKERLVGTIEVRPAAGEQVEQPDAPVDTRPAPGARVTFVEELTEEKMTPVPARPGTAAPEPAAGDSKPAGEPAQPRVGAESREPIPESPAPVAEARPTHPIRFYTIRSVTRGGRPGAVSQPITVPLAPPPPPPGAVTVQFTERAILLDWLPPVPHPGGATVAFNVYLDEGAAPALNASPLPTPEFRHERVIFGEEQCFVVRSVETIDDVAIESEPSSRACTTPRDIFPPAAPARLQVVAAADGISLSWDANTEPDLGGYVVLRGDAPDGTLRPLTPGPIAEPSYRDTTVQPGARYIYAVVAVDTATPPNTSALSDREEVTAR